MHVSIGNAEVRWQAQKLVRSAVNARVGVEMWMALPNVPAAALILSELMASKNSRAGPRHVRRGLGN